MRLCSNQFLWIISCFALVTWAACGSDSAPDAGTADAGTADSGTDGGMVSTGTITCARYCAAVQANCTGENAQYSSSDTCLASCGAFPLGMLADERTNTVACRSNHADLAARSPETECAAAGPGGANVCGAVCDSYCDLATKYCAQPYLDSNLYADLLTCREVCAGFLGDAQYSTASRSGRERSCLVYYAQLAAAEPMLICTSSLAKTATIAARACH